MASIALLFVNSSLIRSAINNKKKEEPTTTQEQPTTTKKQEQTTTRQERPTSLGDDWEDEVQRETPEPPQMLEAPKPSGNAIKVVPTYEGAVLVRIGRSCSTDGFDDGWSRVIYNAEGKVLGREEYDENGILTGWESYVYEYDEKGNLIKEAYGAYDNEGYVFNQEDIVYEYDEKGNMIRWLLSSYSEGIVYQQVESIYEYDYDEKGNVIKKVETESYIYDYDEKGHVTKRPGTGENVESFVLESYEYYENGKVKRHYDYDNCTVYEYDEKGILLRTLDSDTMDIREEYECDEKGNIIVIKDSSGAIIERKEYHKNGELKKVIFYDLDIEKWSVIEYDEYGNLLSGGYYEGEATPEAIPIITYVKSYEYDSEGNVISEYYDAYHDDYHCLYIYDKSSVKNEEPKKPSNEGVALRVTEVDDYENGEVSGWRVCKYDAEGKIIGVENYNINGNFTGFSETAYKYDAKGNLIEEHIKTYDAKGKLINDFVKNSYTYEYDSNGNIKTKHWLEGAIIYEYDSNGYIVAERETRPRVIGDAKSYIYKNDAEGKVVEKIKYLNGEASGRTTYEYKGNFIRELCYNEAGIVDGDKLYDKYGNVFSEWQIKEYDTFTIVSDEYLTCYYDKEGNILQKKYFGETNYIYEKLQ